MELDERKLSILRMVIDDYIMTAAPVGSRTISKRGELGLSSATIRNEMSDLEEMGYLDSPHTSAGRIPSEKAYRLYVDTLMHTANLTSVEAGAIYSHLRQRMHEVKDVINQTAKVLSDMTNYTAMVMAPQFEKAALKRIKLVHVAEGKALAVFVMDNGLVQDTMITIPSQVDERTLDQYSDMFTKLLFGKSISEAAQLMDEGLLMNPQYAYMESIIKSIQSSCEEEDAGYVALGGTTNLLMHPEYSSDVNKARSMLAALETRKNLKTLLSRPKKMEFTITIGNENELDELKDSSVITAVYKIGSEPVGSFGVIGPTRMNYSRVISIMHELVKSMKRILTEMLIDD